MLPDSWTAPMINKRWCLKTDDHREASAQQNKSHFDISKSTTNKIQSALRPKEMSREGFSRNNVENMKEENDLALKTQSEGFRKCS